MAILDVGNRLIIPGNQCGSAFIIGQNIVEQCDNNEQSTFITDLFNQPRPLLPDGNYGPRGLYPSLLPSKIGKKRPVCMKAIYKIMMPQVR